MVVPEFVTEYAFNILGLIILAFLYPLLRHIYERVCEWYELRKLHPLARSLQVNRDIQTLLIETRTKLNADRVYVAQFHNGQTFTSNNSVWRVSRTQEVCAPGIASAINHHQSMLASLLWDALLPIVDPKSASDLKGCYVKEVGSADKPFHIYLYKISELEPSYFKSMYLNEGVSLVLKVPIRNSTGHAVGFMAINYLDMQHFYDLFPDCPQPLSANCLDCSVKYCVQTFKCLADYSLRTGMLLASGNQHA